MSTITPDHITMVSQEVKVNQNVFEIVGKACFIAVIYPSNYRARLVGIIMKKGGGTGTLEVVDKVASEEQGERIVLGSFEFDESEERPIMFELENIPQANENYSAYITLEAKNNGQGFVEVHWAAFEVS